MSKRSDSMSNYRRLISYIYAYEGDIKGKNVGFAKVEVRNGQCKIQVSVKKIFESGNEVGVYLLTNGQEIFIGRMYVRNGNGEFRTNVAAENIEKSGISINQIYGLTVHDVKNPWVSYTTIWEDAVAHTAQLDLRDVTSANCRKEETEMDRAIAIVREIEEEVKLQEIKKEQMQKNSLQILKKEIDKNDYALPDTEEKKEECQNITEHMILCEIEQTEEKKEIIAEKKETIVERREITAEKKETEETITEIEEIIDIGESEEEIINKGIDVQEKKDIIPEEMLEPIEKNGQEDDTKIEKEQNNNRETKNVSIRKEDIVDVSDPKEEKAWMDQFEYDTAGKQTQYIQKGGGEGRKWECEPQDIRKRITESRSRRRGAEKSFLWSAIPLSAAKQLVGFSNERKEKYPQERMEQRRGDNLVHQITFQGSKEHQKSEMDSPKLPLHPKMEEKAKKQENVTYINQPQNQIPMGHSPIMVEFKQDVKRLEELEREETNCPDHAQKLWDSLKKIYPKMQEFDYESGCEILAIKPKDIGLLPIENWILGSNSFLLHGYYNYRYLILVQLTEKDGKNRYLLGVPGHYYNNDKYMASMFGFPGFVLSKKQPTENGRFGYWYTNITLDAEEL